MAKRALPLLTGGINDVTRSDLIDNSQLQECLNYEISGDGILKRRTEPETFDDVLNTVLSGLFDTVKVISEPYYFVTDIDLTNSDGYTLNSDYIILAFGYTQIGTYEMHTLYKVGETWTNTAKYSLPIGTETTLNSLLTDAGIIYTADSDVQFVVSDDRIIITDNVNVAHFATIDIDGLFRAGKLGMPAPKNKARVSHITEWDSSLFEETSTDARLSHIGLFQCTYTAVTKDGHESNPSPLSDTLDMQFFKIDANGADERWIDKVSITDLSVPEMPENDLEDLKYFKVYMRVMRYSEGVTIQTLDLTERFEIINKSISATSTGNNYSLTVEITAGDTVSYENDVAPIAKTAASLSGITMVGNVQTKINFPHEFKYYHPITLSNKDNKHYVDAVVKVRLWDAGSTPDGNDTVIEHFNVNDFSNGDHLSDSRAKHIRLYDEDTTTPIMACFKTGELVAGGYLDLYIKIPLLVAGSSHVVYLCWTDEANIGNYEGVPDIYNDIITDDFTWDGNIGVHYGRFHRTGVWSWHRQQVWNNSRVKNPASVIVTPQEFEISGQGALNKANANIGGTLADVETSTGYISSLPQFQSFSDYKIGSKTYKTTADGSFDSGYIKYDLTYSDASAQNSSPIDLTRGYFSCTFTFIPSEVQAGEFGSKCQIFSMDGLSTSTYLFLSSSNSDRIHFAYGLSSVHSGDASDHISVDHFDISEDVSWAEDDTTTYTYNIFFTWDFATGEALLYLYNTALLFTEGSGISSEELNLLIADENHFDFTNTNLIEIFGATDAASSIAGVYIDNIIVNSNEYITDKNRIFQLWNFQPMYESMIGEGWNDDTYNNNIDFDETKEIKYKSNRNMVKWTDVNGKSFPDLYFKKVREPIIKIMPAPSFLQFEYQNTFIIFTRNSINRFVLQGSASGWGGSSSSLIEEKKQYGLLAEKSLVRAGDALFWLSEVGVVKWDSNGLGLITKNIININYNSGIHGYYVPLKDQYVLQVLNVSYPKLYLANNVPANVEKGRFYKYANTDNEDIDYAFIGVDPGPGLQEAFKSDNSPMYEIGDTIIVTNEYTNQSEMMLILSRPTESGYYYTVQRAYENTDKVGHNVISSKVGLSNVPISYVYHIGRGVWTKFDNIETSQSISLTGGSQRENVNLFLKHNEGIPKIDLYPTDNYTTTDSNIKTKELFFEKGTLKRIKANYGGTYGFKHLQSTVKALNNVDKYHTIYANSEEWRGIPLNVNRGKSVTFQINNADTISSIMYELDIESEVKV